MRILLAICVCPVLAACGGTSAQPASASVSGQIDTRPGLRSFSAQDAVVHQQRASGFAFNGPGAFVEITDYAGACKVESGGVASPGDGQRLLLALAQNDASGNASPPAAPGTFTLLPGSAGSANQLVADAYYEDGCRKADQHFGVSGSVTLTAVGSDGSLTGSFDLVIAQPAGVQGATPGGVHLTGQFHALSCASLDVNRSLSCN